MADPRPLSSRVNRWLAEDCSLINAFKHARFAWMTFIFIIRLEARLQPNIGFTFERSHRMHDFTNLRQPNFTKFEHNTSIGVAMKLFGTKFWQFSRKGSFFFQKRKNVLFFSTSCNDHTLCFKRTSHLWLAIIFTYTVRLQQFFAKMLPTK